MFTQTDPALENSVDVTFAPYNFTYPDIDVHFSKAKLNTNNNKWSEVFDFTPNLQKRNWSILSPDNLPNLKVKEIEGLNYPPPNPVLIPIAYGGTDDRII